MSSALKTLQSTNTIVKGGSGSEGQLAALSHYRGSFGVIVYAALFPAGD